MTAILAFFLSPVGRFVAVGLIAFTVGAVGGWRTHSRIATANYYRTLVAAYQKKVATLEDRVKQFNDAATNDQQRALAAEQQRLKAEQDADALKAQISAGQCFSAADTDKLRQLWTARPRR